MLLFFFVFFNTEKRRLRPQTLFSRGLHFSKIDKKTINMSLFCQAYTFGPCEISNFNFMWLIEDN